MSLFLKYRPRNFAEVIGQDHIVTTLENAARRDQLVHAYLFYGSRGTGKTSVARILAKILLIHGIENDVMEQQIIKAADEGSLVDLIEIDAATNRQIDDVRDLKEKVQFSPTIAAAKVYIIDEVHMMTKEAFNALLKTLEEPPPHAFFILATTELHKVPETIQSRCQRFAFRRIGDEDIVRGLQNIADREHITVDRDALRAIARYVNGGMRDAVAMLDQLSSLEEITETDVRERIGQSGEEYVTAVWDAVERGDAVELLSITSSLQENGIALEVFLRQLLAHARETLHEDLEEGKDIATILRRMDAVIDALKDIRISPVPAAVLEKALIGLCLQEGGIAPKKDRRKEEAVVEARQKLEKKADESKKKKDREEEIQAEGASASRKENFRDAVIESDEEKAEKDDAVFEAKEITVDVLKNSWKAILAGIKTPSVRMSLKDATIVKIEGKELILAFSSAFHRDKVAGTSGMTELLDAIERQFDASIPVQCILGGSAMPVATSAGQSEDSVNIAEAVEEIFG